MDSPLAAGVLVVDDDAMVLAYLADHLRECGFAPCPARDASEALRLCRACHDGIFLALIDVDLPGVDGLGLVDLLRQEAPEIRCCFMTGGYLTARQHLALESEIVFPMPFPRGGIGPRLRNLREAAGAVGR